jgi:hypothetical protein
MRGRFLLLMAVLFPGMVLFAADGAESVPIPLPKLAPFKLEKANAVSALAEVRRLYGIAVEDRLGPSSEFFSIDQPRTTFWPVFDAIARATHGRVDLYARDGRLTLARRPTGYVEPPLSYSGLFRAAIKRITASRDLESGVTTCTAKIEVAWEPTLEPLLLETSPRALTVHDDRGHPLPCREEGSLMAAVDGRLALEFDVPLPTVPRSVPTFGLIEGKLSAVAPSKMLSFTFDTLERLAEVPAGSSVLLREQDGVTCRLGKPQLTRERWSLRVTLDYPPRGVKLESYQSRLANNEMTLEAIDGSRRLPAAGYVLEQDSDRKAIITYHFFDADKGKRGQPAEWKVRYRTPAALVEVPLAFSFKDVALP